MNVGETRLKVGNLKQNLSPIDRLKPPVINLNLE